MALTDHGAAGGNAVAATLNIGTVAAGTVIYAFVAGSGTGAYAYNAGTGVPASPPTGGGLTWTKRGSTPIKNNGINFVCLSLYTAVGNGGSVTVDTGSPLNATATAEWAYLNVWTDTAAAQNFTNVAIDDDTAGDPNIAISTPAANSKVIAAGLFRLDKTHTARTGYTNSTVVEPQTDYTVVSQYSTGNPPATPAGWTSANNACVGIAIEIFPVVPASLLPPSIPPAVMHMLVR